MVQLNLGDVLLQERRDDEARALFDACLPVFERCGDQQRIAATLHNLGQIALRSGGLETAGGYGLLRSLVVHPDYRENGLARGLCEYLLRRARKQRLQAVYLLTESAAAYFEKFGFSHCSREEAPAEIRATRQFAALCPDSAACLVFDLPKSA